MNELEKETPSILHKNNLINYILIGAIAALSLYYFSTQGLFSSINSQSKNDREAQIDTGSTRTVFVNIEGAVKNPGVYELEEGSRINDVVSRAGGFSTEADIRSTAQSINKAQLLTDGLKIYIPSISEGSTQDQGMQTSTNSPPQTLISINTGTQKELESLPGVGPVTAGKIISGRPYMDIASLIDNNIISESRFKKIQDLISL
ncbi:MAG: SLBB domain-containing protein [Candidatus Dojkabacteria bacterium]